MTKLKSFLFAASALVLLGISACKDPSDGTGGNSADTSTPRYTVSFAVEGGNGTLKAEVDGREIASGASVEQGKTVTFTAEPVPGCEVERWTNNGTVIGKAGKRRSWKHTVTADTDIKVEFQASFVEGGASLIVSPDKLDIKVKTTTADGSSVRIEGCAETTLTSGAETVLHAKGTLVIFKGNIKKLDFSGWFSSDYSNKLIALNVQGLAALQELFCYKTQLVKLNVQGCSALKLLSCYENLLTELNVQGLTGLRTLECGRNKLTALDVQGLNALQWLACTSNQLTELNVQGLNALQHLSCGGNQLTELNVQGLTVLQKLYCWGNQLTALNVQGLTALKELYCHNNQFTVLNVQGLPALQRLSCRGNQFNSDVFIKLFNDLPVRADSDHAWCYLYTEKSGFTEGNHTDFTAPADLAAAFNKAKTEKKWKMYKHDESGNAVEI